MRDFLSFILLLGGSLLAAHITEISGLDFWLQKHFFIAPQAWFIDGADPFLKMIFYKGPKQFLMTSLILGLLYTFYDMYQYGIKTWHRRFFFFISCMIAVPLIISLLKEITFVYCPGQLTDFGGPKTFRELIDFRNVPAFEGRGKCFPAGHATTGFALMSLYYMFENKWTKRFLLLLGLTLGWIFSFYQIAKGAHFLSHSIATMGLSWCVIWSIKKIFDRFGAFGK